MKKCKIPKKLSGLIRLAVKDLTLVERSKGMKVHMGRWFEESKSTCLVCFAGSVMAKTCKAESYHDFILNHSMEEADKIRCLDDIRNGLIHSALQEFHAIDLDANIYINLPAAFYLPNRVKVPNYTPATKREFKKAMLGIAAMLEAQKL